MEPLASEPSFYYSQMMEPRQTRHGEQNTVGRALYCELLQRSCAFTISMQGPLEMIQRADSQASRTGEKENKRQGLRDHHRSNGRRVWCSPARGGAITFSLNASGRRFIGSFATKSGIINGFLFEILTSYQMNTHNIGFKSLINHKVLLA